MAKAEQSKELTVPTLLYSAEGIGEFRKLATPKHLTPERIARVALTSWKQSADLQKCDPRSFLKAVILSAELGLEPNNAIGHSWIIPYGKECQLQIGYKGLIHLAHRSPDVLMVEGHAVRKDDEFDFEYGSSGFIRHRPKIDDLPEEWVEREDIRAFWAGVKMRNGAYKFEVMAARDVWDIEKRYSKGKRDDRPWITSPAQQGIKTVIKRLLKQVPLTVETDQAVAVDDATERGETYNPIDMGAAEIVTPSDGPLTPEQRAELEKICTNGDAAEALDGFLGANGYKTISDIPASRFEAAKAACK